MVLTLRTRARPRSLKILLRRPFCAVSSCHPCRIVYSSQPNSSAMAAGFVHIELPTSEDVCGGNDRPTKRACHAWSKHTRAALSDCGPLDAKHQIKRDRNAMTRSSGGPVLSSATSAGTKASCSDAVASDMVTIATASGTTMISGATLGPDRIGLQHAVEVTPPVSDVPRLWQAARQQSTSPSPC